jgi:hypothetical protein
MIKGIKFCSIPVVVGHISNFQRLRGKFIRNGNQVTGHPIFSARRNNLNHYEAIRSSRLRAVSVINKTSAISSTL